MSVRRRAPRGPRCRCTFQPGILPTTRTLLPVRARSIYCSLHGSGLAFCAGHCTPTIDRVNRSSPPRAPRRADDGEGASHNNSRHAPAARAVPRASPIWVRSRCASPNSPSCPRVAKCRAPATTSTHQDAPGASFARWRSFRVSGGVRVSRPSRLVRGWPTPGVRSQTFAERLR